MTDLNYYRTLIAVAEDCPVDGAVVPVPRLGKRTIAVLQYELLADRPHVLTQEELLFECWVTRQAWDAQEVDDERETLWREFRQRSHACLRSSPLPRSYGWGLLFDDRGRVALCPCDSSEYRRLARGGEVEVLTALNAHWALTR